MRRLISTACLAILTALAPAPAVAQNPVGFSLGGRFAAVRVDGTPAASAAELTGPSVGFDGELRVLVFTLEAQYQHAALTATGSGAPHTMLEGNAMAGVRPMRWIHLSAGPRVRDHLLPEGRHRTLQWEARLQVETVLIPDYGRAVVNGWRALYGELNSRPQSFASGRGGQAFFELTAPPIPGSLRVGYRMDRSTFGDGRVETLEQLFVTAGFGAGR